MKLSRTQRAVLRYMNKGAVLTGSGIGQARLCDGRVEELVSPQTHGALIRRGLVARVKGSNSRPGSMVFHWYLTERGLLEAVKAEDEARSREPLTKSTIENPKSAIERAHEQRTD